MPHPVSAPDDSPEPADASAPGVLRRRLADFGKEGLAVSLLTHLALLGVATTWVLTSYVTSGKPERFNTGAAGGGGGERTVATKAYVKPPAKSLVRTPSRLTAKSAASSIVLPELPSPLAFSSMLSGSASPALNKGFGIAPEALPTTAKGLGTGVARNFSGQPVMGMKILGKKIAVYLDNSGSMRPYLDSVEKEIRDKFPTADVFRYYGIFLNVEDGEILGTGPGKKYATPTAERFYTARAPGAPDLSVTRVEKLSVLGREIYNSKNAQFRIGSVGAWVDTMMMQKYDTLVIFSDFADGIQQWRKVPGGNPELVHDADLRPVLDRRTDAEKAWENRWLERFSKAPLGGAPHLFIFSTDFQPQALWKRCVEVSGGEYKMIELPKYAAPKTR